MQGHFWHLFLAQLFMLFHMIACIFFSMAAPITAYFKDSDWLLEEFWQIRKWLKKLPWRAKPRQPWEKAWKAGSEAGVKSDLAFCLRWLIEKTNSALRRKRAMLKHLRKFPLIFFSWGGLSGFANWWKRARPFKALYIVRMSKVRRGLYPSLEASRKSEEQYNQH